MSPQPSTTRPMLRKGFINHCISSGWDRKVEALILDRLIGGREDEKSRHFMDCVIECLDKGNFILSPTSSQISDGNQIDKSIFHTSDPNWKLVVPANCGSWDYT